MTTPTQPAPAVPVDTPRQASTKRKISAIDLRISALESRLEKAVAKKAALISVLEKIAAGKSPNGSRANKENCTRVTHSQRIMEILRDHPEGLRSKDLAEKIGVSAGHISNWYCIKGVNVPGLTRPSRGFYKLEISPLDQKAPATEAPEAPESACDNGTCQCKGIY